MVGGGKEERKGTDGTGQGRTGKGKQALKTRPRPGPRLPFHPARLSRSRLSTLFLTLLSTTNHRRPIDKIKQRELFFTPSVEHVALGISSLYLRLGLGTRTRNSLTFLSTNERNSCIHTYCSSTITAFPVAATTITAATHRSLHSIWLSIKRLRVRVLAVA